MDTHLWVYANQRIRSVVELFFQRDYDDLEMILWLVADVSSNLVEYKQFNYIILHLKYYLINKITLTDANYSVY